MSDKIKDKNFIKKILVYFFLYIATSGIVLSTFYIPPMHGHDFPFFRALIVIFASVLLTKYFIYMSLSPWHDFLTYLNYFKKEFSNDEIKPYRPKVSIVIPAWNEEVGLLSTVKTILSSTYRNIEIVVVNDGSTDNSDALMRQFLAEYKKNNYRKRDKLKIVYHYKQNAGKGEALNTGINLSSGEIIMSIDADCLIMEDTVANFVKCFEDPKVMAAVGNVKIGNTKTILGLVQHLEFLFSFYFKKAESLANVIYIIGGAAGAFRKDVFDKIGLYNPKNITEDIELSVRIQKAGMKIVYAADAIVYTEGATTLSGLMKQRLRWKRGRFQTFYDHKDLFFSKKNYHNKLLTWISLPIAVFGDAQLFFELFFVAFLYAYSYMIRDFSSFISGIVVVGSMFLVQILFDDKRSHKGNLYLLAPIGWLLFYISTVVEFNALIKSIWGFYRKKEIKWQKWQRTGVEDLNTLDNKVKIF